MTFEAKCLAHHHDCEFEQQNTRKKYIYFSKKHILKYIYIYQYFNKTINYIFSIKINNKIILYSETTIGEQITKGKTQTPTSN